MTSNCFSDDDDDDDDDHNNNDDDDVGLWATMAIITGWLLEEMPKDSSMLPIQVLKIFNYNI